MKHFFRIAPFFCLIGFLSAQDHSSTARAEVAQRDSKQTAWTPGMPEATAPTLGEDQEIYLLQQSEPFYVRSFTGLGYSSNVFSDSTGTGDNYLSQDLALGFETLIANRYYFYTEASSSIVRYDEFDVLDRETAAASVGLNADLSKTISIGIGYSHAWYFNGGFSENDSTFQTVAVSANWLQPLPQGSYLSLGPSVSRVWASPSDFDQVVYSLGGGIIMPLDQKKILGITGFVSYSDFDNYFQSTFNEDRHDLTFGFGAWLSIRPSDMIEIRPEVTFTSNDSSFSVIDPTDGSSEDFFDYESWDVVPSLQVKVYF
ncbi:MAG: hypothetical protein ACI8UO_004157 [Verrucomicrobiales bacterium]|jgi:hypothetical protein